MRRIGTFAIASTMLFSALIAPSIVSEAATHGGNAPDNLVITSVTMSDYNLKCRALGGDTVDICVEVKNQGSDTITEDFQVFIFVDTVTHIDTQSVTTNIAPGQTHRVHFYTEDINAEIGDHTLDAYINDDGSARGYCTFEVTLLGIGNS
ncbi:MAG: CARDB domain-containing protein [Candidatus Thermoplasmatota archaeon]|nr:CARDB domain-containing protein [Candidatus Thermoplasmatota archaeon]